jgi:ectoine hydroxylase-related dioxygenase (phytanoyl-CoA dioxygenase family)
MAWPDPAGAIEVTARPGDAVIFDRRVWHARSVNQSAVTRKAVFFGYTYRWVASRDEPVDPAGLHLIQTQLFGDGGDHLWSHHPRQDALYEYLREHGFSDPASPPLKS